MARFPYRKKNVKALGELLAKAALDERLKTSLQKDPAKFLSEIGLPEQTTSLIDFEVVDQKNEPKAVALPYRLNDHKLSSSNRAYLSSLSQMFSLN